MNAYDCKIQVIETMDLGYMTREMVLKLALKPVEVTWLVLGA
jgi:cellobiose-specific phosphotransferase system component IIB